MVCALFGLSFGQENDFRENTKRDLPVNLETIKPCLDAVSFASFRTISKSYRSPESVTSADFNNDGQQDIVVAFSTGNKVVLYKNDGSDNWSASVLGTVNGATSVFAVDLNGDSRVDVVAASATDNTVYWFKNTVSGWTQYTVGTATNPQSVFVADINGDTKPDIIAAGTTITWFENNIDSISPNAWTSFPVTYTGSSVDSVFGADIDKDGFIDLVVASQADNAVIWLANVGGSGTNFTEATIATPAGPVQVFCTDMDNDTYVDVMTVNKDGNSTSLYYNSISVNHTVPAGNNNTAPTASSQWVGIFVDSAQNMPESIFAADINGDGRQDIVVAITGSNLVNWYNATNAYTWTSHRVGNTANPTYVFARDIAGFNSKDVIVASAVNNTVGWLEELCATSLPGGGDDDHIVGWVVAGAVIGGLLILWILIAVVIAIHDFVKSQIRKDAEQRRKEAKALVQPTEMHEEL
jgi:hypothetical protein